MLSFDVPKLGYRAHAQNVNLYHTESLKHDIEISGLQMEDELA